MSRTLRKDYDNNKWVPDSKPYYKPNKEFKTLSKRSRKAKEKEALRLEKEVIPEFPKSNQYDWN
jgi:hypothetical protein